MTRLPIIATLALLAGCASTPPERVRTMRVEVPVAVPCTRPALPPRPVLPLAALPADASDADVARATLASLHAVTGYAAQIETLLGAAGRDLPAAPPAHPPTRPGQP